MRNLLRNCFKWQWLVCLTVALCISSCKDDSDGVVLEYDPNQPVVLTDFYPKIGPISTQVILNGQNFGNKKDNVKVFFNEKEAAVLSVKGNKMLVLAPKLPGEECVIKVQVGDQSGQFKDIFDYIIQTNISTIVGGDKNATGNPSGTISLAEAQFKDKPEQSIYVDANKNVYATFGGATSFLYVINEEADKIRLVKEIGDMLCSAILGYDIRENVIYRFHTNTGHNDYSYFNPNNDYAEVKMGNVLWDDSKVGPDGMGSWGARKCLSMCPTDGKFYFRSNGGYLARFDPLTGDGENLTHGREIGTKDGSTNAIVFDKNNPNIFYFPVDSKHCIFRYDLSTDECTLFAGLEGQKGYLDGPKEEAKFNQPCQMCIDSEGNLYVADRENHCIRKITLKTGYVSTVAGLPQKAGYVNGTNEVAQFNKPIGLTIDSDDVLYVGDSENHAIRRVAVE